VINKLWEKDSCQFKPEDKAWKICIASAQRQNFKAQVPGVGIPGLKKKRQNFNTFSV
jgi:hypothetical protein